METGSPEQRDRGDRRRQEEGGDAAPDSANGSVLPAEPQQPPPGKLKKTAFKLFGGKRSICTLPSFFGGRGKKGLSKCKTHDGLSGAAGGRGGPQPESPSEGSRDGRPCPLPGSRSAQLAADARGDSGQQDASPPGSIEGCDKKPNGEKSSLPRPKKGLKGFLNSIRRHRKSKAAESEKAEAPEWRGDADEAGSAAAAGAESRGAAEGRGAGPEAEACPRADSSCGEATEPTGPAADGSSCEAAVAALPGRGDAADAECHAEAAACAEFDRDSLLLAFHPDFMDSEPPCLHSGDLLSLMLGDVTSLKSFDSLTGCGDDIAEPDIAESSISVERSRDAAKRGSCLVTYQGGGEEMAIPEEAEEYLQQVWDGGVPGDGSYGAQVSSSSLETHASHEADAQPYVGDAVDLLTPQSDQQESAPNSDEGYYDSTTPGPDDEAGEELRKDRLPRDSYSGDALYEFDALMSPSHGEESLFEGKVPHQGIFSYFMDFCLPAEKSLIQQMMDHKRGLVEAEEEGLAAIQKELLFWELQREPALDRLDVCSKEKCPREKQCIECTTRGSSAGKGPSGLAGEQVASRTPSRAGSGGLAVARPAEPAWGDFPGTLGPENCYGSQKGPAGCLIQLAKSGAGLDAGAECGASAGLFPAFALPEQGRGGAEPALGEAPPGGEPELAVSFSQALVEFASSGTLFSSLSESLGSSASSSSFTQNLPALPTMVTFDVVDVEQDGEGQCEQHPELTAGEDIAEAFDDGYGQKESLAECDERMSPGFAPGPFQSCNWGVASLPRHLRLHLSPSMPAPLSVDRRSRSLDTESLEFELAEPQGRSGPQPCRLWARREAARKDSAGARRSRSKEEGELVAPEGGLSWPGLRHLQHCADAGMELWDLAPAGAAESAWEPAEPPGSVAPFLPLSRGGIGEAPREPEPSRHPLRPSHLPLAPGGRPREAAAPYRHRGDVPKLSRLGPLGEAELPPSCGFGCSPERRARGKPVGIAQGVPQQPGGGSGDTESPERCAEPLKGRATLGHCRGSVCRVADAE
ncbi:AMER1 protein, partial [Spelaeornis formosus]|nr:AMER1 protein [Elachura formosa]